MLSYILAAVAAVFLLILTFFSRSISDATHMPIAIVQLLILALAAGAVAGFLWMRKRGKDNPEAAEGASTPQKSPKTGELDQLLQEAESKIASSKRSSVKTLRALPLLYILGEENSAKTTVVMKSGLEPELLAGQIYRDKDVVPTPLANIWY